ncbi:beta-lactamase [Reticulomyxa filosa]|uniref:Beta-lactamase n=1 Tax=Reticulomyxa filosa TaxID=46433 RepID=X6NC33_RETFI|nr:beta-lactamase [Reticulomyxa filosa]|eukprot:ETO23586.1 beta-lactamase [Reticulomyxa filosa]
MSNFKSAKLKSQVIRVKCKHKKCKERSNILKDEMIFKTYRLVNIFKIFTNSVFSRRNCLHKGGAPVLKKTLQFPKIDRLRALKRELLSAPDTAPSGCVEAIRDYLWLQKQLVGFPGCSITIIHKNRVIMNEGLGYIDLENRVAATSESVYRIASISKTLTSTALGVLLYRKQLQLDDSITKTQSKYDITIRQCASHTSGIRHYNPKSNEFLSQTRYESSKQALKIFEKDPLLFVPGTNFYYSTYNYTVLSAIIESITKQSFESFLQTQVFCPLQMDHTYCEYHSPIIPHRSKQYKRNDSHTQLINAPFVDNSNKFAGGGVLSTSWDIAWFGHVLINRMDDELLLPKDVVLQLLAPYKRQNIDNKDSSENMLLTSKDGKKYGYGIGWKVQISDVCKSANGDDIVYLLEASHSGGACGGSSFLLVRPKEQLVVCIMINFDDAPVTAIATQIAQIVESLI